MLPEASSCAHISVKDQSHQSIMMARLFSILPFYFSNSVKSIVCFFLFFVLYPGCSSTSQVEAVHQKILPDSIPHQVEIEPDSALDGDEEVPETDLVERPFSVSNDSAISEENTSIDRHKVLSEIMGLMRKPYRKKGNGRKGFDCSGFTSKIFNETIGVAIPRSSREQYRIGQPVDPDSLKFGDLVFFKTRRRIPSHVGIYIGDGFFAHASFSIGVTVSLLESNYYKRRYLGARRVVD